MGALIGVLVAVAVMGAAGVVWGLGSRRLDDGRRVAGLSQWWRMPRRTDRAAPEASLPGDVVALPRDPEPRGSPDAELPRRVPLPPEHPAG